MEKINLNPELTQRDICGTEWAYWLKTVGKPNFETLKDLADAVLAKVTVPEWAKGNPVIGYTSGGSVFGKPTVMWYTGESFLGGEFNNRWYFSFNGFSLGQEELVPSPLYWYLGEPEPLEFVSAWAFPEQETIKGDPHGGLTKPFAIGDGIEFAKANALTQFHVYGKVSKDLQVAPKAIELKRDHLRNTPEYFQGLPVFWSFYGRDDVFEFMGVGGDIARRLLKLGILRKVDVPKEEQQMSWPIAHAVAPTGVNKIIILDPLGIVILRDDQFQWWQIDLVSGEERKMTPSTRKAFKSLKGGSTRYQVWWHAKGNKYNEKCVVLEKNSRDEVPYHWPTNDPYWRQEDFKPDPITLTHRQMAKLLRVRKNKPTIVAELV